MDTPLYGFAGEVVHPLGVAILPLSLGTGKTERSMLTRFLVVDIPSAYNAIIGRPVLNDFQAVVSTYHMKVKFPIKGGVDEVAGNQMEARKYYVQIIKQGKKTKERDNKKPGGNDHDSKKE